MDRFVNSGAQHACDLFQRLNVHWYARACHGGYRYAGDFAQLGWSFWAASFVVLAIVVIGILRATASAFGD